MGWLHVSNSGKGVCINKLGFNEYYEIPQINIDPFQDIIDNYFKTSCLKNEISKGLNRLIAIGYEATDYHGYARPEAEDLTNKIIEDLEDYEIKQYVLKGIGVLFSLYLSLPIDSFICTSDYNGDAMLYCNVLAPFDDEHSGLSNLSENMYLHKLKEFFRKLMSEEYFTSIEALEIEICEEYVKD